MEKIVAKPLIWFQGIVHRIEEASRQVEVDPEAKNKGAWGHPKTKNNK